MRIGDVRELGRALVGGDHQVGIVAVVAHDRGRRDHLAADHVVGDVEQRTDERAIALGSLGLRLVAAGGQAARHEAALGADRHDHGVLDVLRLHQAEDLGAEVLTAVRPAQAAARDAPHAQVHALDARRMHEDLVHRLRQRHFRDPARIELQRQVGLRRAVRARLEVIGAQRRVDRGQERAQDAVVVDARDAREQPVERAPLRGLGAPPLARLQGRVEARDEQLQRACRRRRRCSRAPLPCRPATAACRAGRTSARRSAAPSPRAR